MHKLAATLKREDNSCIQGEALCPFLSRQRSYEPVVQTFCMDAAEPGLHTLPSTSTHPDRHETLLSGRSSNRRHTRCHTPKYPVGPHASDVSAPIKLGLISGTLRTSQGTCIIHPPIFGVRGGQIAIWQDIFFFL